MSGISLQDAHEQWLGMHFSRLLSQHSLLSQPSAPNVDALFAVSGQLTRLRQ